MDYMKLDIQLFADGKVVIETDLNTKAFEQGLNRMQRASNQAGTTIKNIVAGLGITKLISSAISMINNSIDDAVARFDTLNNFPKVMSNLNISTEEAQESIDKMSEKLMGLPTTLDQGAAAVQRFTSKNNNVKKSTDLFLALNNAILAGGASSEIQASALEQLSQAYAKGKPDMMEWRTAMMAMPAQLKQVAIAMGYVDADALGEALRNGAVSMDEFMNKIVELNTKGANGFKSFEEQARNSTDGIRTSLTNMKSRVTQGVTAVIESLDKGLKNSNMGGLADLFANIGNTIRDTLKKTAKYIEKLDFKKLIKTIKTLVPIVGGLTAAFVAYNGVLKALQIKATISRFTSLLKATTKLSPALLKTKTATLAFNAALNVSPIGLLVAGVAGFTAGLYLLSKAAEKSASTTSKLNDSLSSYKKNMKEAEQARQEYLDQNMNEIKSTKDLYVELQGLVDENGKIKEGYEARAQFLIDQLNPALETEMKITDGVITNYQEMKKSIDNILESKRAKVLLDAQENVYNKAKDEQAKLEENYARAVENVTQKEKERNKVLEKIKKEYNLVNLEVDKHGKLVAEYADGTVGQFDPTIMALTDLGKEWQEVNANMVNATNTLNSTGKAYANNQKIIGDYEYALTQMSASNYQAVFDMYEDTTNYQAKTKEATYQNYDYAIKAQENYLNKLVQNSDKYNKDVYNAEVNATKQKIENLRQEQEKYKTITDEGQKNVEKLWKQSLSNQLTEITGHNIKFVETGKGTIQAYIDGQKQGKEMSKKEAQQFAKDIEKEIKKVNSKEAGENVVTGFNSGFNSKKGSSFGIVASYGADLLKTLKKSLKEKSPSKATKEFGQFFTQGFDEGIENGSKASIKEIQNYGNDLLEEFESIDFKSTIDSLYSDMKNAVNLETSKMQNEIEMGGVFNSIANKTPFVINLDANVEMDGQKVGRLVAPSVSQTVKTKGGYQ